MSSSDDDDDGGGNQYRYVQIMKLPICTIGLTSIAGSVTASLVNGSLPFFPIEISYTACAPPGYEIFAFGMTFTALAVYSVYVSAIDITVRMGKFIKFMGAIVCLSLFSLSWFDVCHFYWVHFTFVTIFFFAADYLVYFKHGNTFYGLAPTMVFTVYGIFLPLEWWAPPNSEFWNQIAAPFQWLTVLLLGISICAPSPDLAHKRLFRQ